MNNDARDVLFLKLDGNVLLIIAFIYFVSLPVCP